MIKDQKTHNIQDIEFEIIYSKRRTLGISVLPDSSVIVRVPYHTTFNTIIRIVSQKASWIRKYRDRYKERGKSNLNGSYESGETHLFRGNKFVLKIEMSNKTYIRFCDSTIELGLKNPDDKQAIKRLLYKGYKHEAGILFSEILNKSLKKYEDHNFKPVGLVLRTMKRRWGSCSNKGIITLSTELIKLPDNYIEYVILHELCHLKHHNHGNRYYNLLSVVYPDWRTVRKELRKYIQ